MFANMRKAFLLSEMTLKQDDDWPCMDECAMEGCMHCYDDLMTWDHEPCEHCWDSDD